MQPAPRFLQPSVNNRPANPPVVVSIRDTVTTVTHFLDVYSLARWERSSKVCAQTLETAWMVRCQQALRPINAPMPQYPKEQKEVVLRSELRGPQDLEARKLLAYAAKIKLRRTLHDPPVREDRENMVRTSERIVAFVKKNTFMSETKKQTLMLRLNKLLQARARCTYTSHFLRFTLLANRLLATFATALFVGVPFILGVGFVCWLASYRIFERFRDVLPAAALFKATEWALRAINGIVLVWFAIVLHPLAAVAGKALDLVCNQGATEPAVRDFVVNYREHFNNCGDFR